MYERTAYDIPTVGQLTSDLNLVVNQWLSEYKLLCNTCHSRSDNLIEKIIMYHLKLPISSDENYMLKEPLDYKEIEFAINGFSLRK